MDEVLLGDNLLKRLGIDVDDQLAQLATVASSQQAESERNHPPLPAEKLKNETNKRDRPKNMKDNKKIMHEELKEEKKKNKDVEKKKNMYVGEKAKEKKNARKMNNKKEKRKMRRLKICKMADTREWKNLSLRRILLAHPEEEPMEGSTEDTEPSGRSTAAESTFQDVASRKTLQEALEEMVIEAKRKGLSKRGEKRLRKLLNDFRDIWRVDLTEMDEPAKVEPMKIQLEEGTKPFRCKARRYPPLHREYMQQITTAMEKSGIIVRNNSSKWAVNTVVVEKNGICQRICGDYKPINAVTIKTIWPMPHIAVIVSHLKGMKYFFVIDLFKGYWQFPLHEDSREYLSFMTHEGVFTPLRVVMGATGSGDYFQATVTEVYKELMFKHLLSWLDDLLGYAKTEQELLDVLEQLFQLSRKRNIKLNAKKCQLFNTEMKWCGKIYTADGVVHDPERIKALTTAQIPQTAADLQQALCAINWMRSHIPKYNEVMVPLTEFMEKVYKEIGSRKKKRLQRHALAKFGWTDDMTYAWKKCLKHVEEATLLAHPDEEQALCVFTDASDRFWSAVVTQVPHEQLPKVFHSQMHQPLLFMSGEFKGSRARWSIVEKEAYPIVHLVIHADYLLRCSRGFHLFTDHRNLCYIFDPYAKNPLCARHTASRLERWSIRLMGLRYKIEFVPGDQNVFADLLTRWGAPAPSAIKAMIHVQEEPNFMSPNKFIWPKATEMIEEQKSLVDKEKLIRGDDDLWRNEKGQIVIPEKAKELQQRLLIIAHAGISGHRGSKATAKILERRFIWKNMKEQVAEFLKQCIHCLAVNGGRKIPRPWGSTMHADKPNQIIWFDFLHVGQSYNGFKYLLTIRCAFSGYIELIPAKQCDSVTASKGLLDWFKRFGIVQCWGSDRGTHFLNQTMAEIARIFGVEHHFVTPYCPWANALIERPNREILAAFRKACSELRIDHSRWIDLVPAVQYSMNQAPRERLQGKTCTYVMTGIDPSDALEFCFPVNLGENITVQQIKESKWRFIEGIAATVEKKIEKIKNAIEKRRQMSIKGSWPKGVKANFRKGDFVLVAKPEKYVGQKLRVIYRGPYRVVSILSDWICVIEHLITKERREAHVSRMKFYADSSLNVTEDLKEYIQHHDGCYEVDQIKDHRRRSTQEGDSLEFLVRWKAFDALEDSWEPAEVLREDVPKMLQKYARDFEQDQLLDPFR